VGGVVAGVFWVVVAIVVVVLAVWDETL